MGCLFCSVIVIALLILIPCCGDTESVLEPTGPPTVLSTDPADGGQIAPNGTVTFTLDRRMASATVTGAKGTAVIQGNKVIFTPSHNLHDGPVTMILTGTDSQGMALEFTLKYTVAGCGCGPPVLRDANPEDGAINVDPREYPDGFELEFDEELSEAKIFSTEPEFGYALTVIGNKVKVEFQDYVMPYETSFEVLIAVDDLAGNMGEIMYSFATMVK